METVSFEDFQKIDLRLADVTSAEKVKGSDKLLRINVKVGEEEKTIVAGISNFYSPNDLVGKKIIIVHNLKPRKIMGIESQGMILALYDGKELSLIVPDKSNIKSGTKVS